MSASNPEHITPTVGRKLWLFVDTSQPRRLQFADVTIYDSREPMDASIARVSDNKGTDFTYITVSFADQAGRMHAATVPLRQAGQIQPTAREWCEWMPYQKGQAAKMPVQTIGDLSLPTALDTLKRELVADPELAWAWQCNIAMPIMDELGIQDGQHETANKAAARLMRHLFDVDITAHPHYLDLARKWAHDKAASTSGTALMNEAWANAQALVMNRDPETGERIAAPVCACNYCRGCDELDQAATTQERAANAVKVFLEETPGAALEAFLADTSPVRLPDTVTNADLNAAIVSEYYHVVPGTTLTLCVLTLRNGFTVTGESACVDPAKFDADKGRKYAFDDAHEKLWPLLGYELKQRRYAAGL